MTNPKYVFDTNVFISLQRLYPPDIFNSLWEKIENLFEAKVIISSDEVIEEIEKGSDTLVDWAAKRKKCFYPSDENIQLIVRDILKYFAPLVTSAKKTNAADPFVIALAKQFNCALVTDEKRGGNDQSPKIPNICERYSIRCIKFFDFLREVNIKI
jgi:hypothetical protein